MPCYNAAAFLPATIESVLAQTYDNFELIIVNDGSKDNSLQIVEEYIRRDKRIALIDRPNSGRPSIARNHGITRATGDILTFLDSDDLFDDSRLEYVAAVFASNPDCSAVFHDHYRIDHNSHKTFSGFVESKWSTLKLDSHFTKLGECWIPKKDMYLTFLDTFFMAWTGSVAFRMANYERSQMYFDEAMTYYEDIKLWNQLMMKRKVIYLPKALTAYRDTPGSLMKNLLSYNVGGIRFYQEQLRLPIVVQSPDYHRNVQGKLAKEYCDSIYSSSRAGQLARTIHIAFDYVKELPGWQSLYKGGLGVLVALIKKCTGSNRI
jgi:glycosyltransferase involved in cell wall biosynthesis